MHWPNLHSQYKKIIKWMRRLLGHRAALEITWWMKLLCIHSILLIGSENVLFMSTGKIPKMVTVVRSYAVVLGVLHVWLDTVKSGGEELGSVRSLQLAGLLVHLWVGLSQARPGQVRLGGAWLVYCKISSHPFHPQNQ